MIYAHGSKTVRRFDFIRASRKIKLSAGLLTELITVKFSAVFYARAGQKYA